MALSIQPWPFGTKDKDPSMVTCAPVSPDEVTVYSTVLGLAERIYQLAQAAPNSPAAEFEGNIMTYAELHGHAIRLSNTLLQKGVLSEEAVGILTGAGIEQTIAQVAVIYAGCTCCPLDPDLPDAQIHHRLTNAGARWCLTDKSHLHSVGKFKSIQIPTDTLAVSELAAGLQVAPVPSSPDHRSHLMHTSGSTGKPKVVQILAKALINLAEDQSSVPVRGGSRIAQMAMVSFDISLYEIWVTLLCGGTIMPIRRSLLTDIQRLTRTWKDLRITALHLPASLLGIVIPTMPTAFEGMEVVFTGGEMPNLPAMKTALDKGPPKHLINCYGPTETCVFSLFHEMTLEDVAQGRCPLTEVVGNTRTMILDENRQPVPDGEVGELLIGGDGVSSGYVNLPEQNLQRFVTSEQISALPPSTNFFVTGDMVRRVKSGEIYVVGRKDNQVKIHGFRIELEGVEMAVMDTGLVAAVAACKVQTTDDSAGASLVAFVVPRYPKTFKASDLASIMKTQVPDHLIPQVEIRESLPLTGHSKVNRDQLVREFLEKTAALQRQVSSQDGENSTLGRLRTVWHSVMPGLGRPIKDTDVFSNLGGGSLQASMLLLRIKRAFSVQVPATMVYDQVSLAEMARYIDNGGEQFTVHSAGNQAYRQDINFYKTLNLPKPSGTAPHWHTENEGRIFLTGATGFIGAFFLHTLLGLPEVSSIVCLVRGKDNSTARKRVMAAQDKYNLRQRDIPYHKVTVLAGRLEDVNMGLGTERFQQLGDWASCIFHVAAHVNYAEPYHTHRAGNVLGTATILRLQATGRPKRLNYMSSMNIYGPTGLVNGYTRVSESEASMKFADAVQYDNGYAQSKWVAEKMVKDALNDGFPISIFRPGSVLCHGRTGMGSPSDFVTRLMISCVRMGCFPTMSSQSKHIVPVDYLIDVMIYLSKQDCSIGQCYNVVPTMNEQPTDELTQMFRMLESVTKPLEQLPFDQWLERLKLQGDEDPLRPLIPMLDEKVFEGYCRWEMYARMPIYGTENLRRDLRDVPALAEGPTLDADLLRMFLSSVNAI